MKNLRRQLLLFCAVGTLGLMVDVGVLHVSAPWLGWYLARVASFLAAASVTWWLNRRLTFATASAGSRSGGAWTQYLQYLLAMMAGTTVNLGVYVVTLQSLSGPWIPTLGVTPGSGAGLAINFLTARKILGRRQE